MTWHAGELRSGCTDNVMSSFHSAPCGNAAKHDPDINGNPTKCGHHSAAAKARKKAKRDERDRAERAKWALRDALWRWNGERDDIIRKIAEGHNDPRGLCLDWLARDPRNEPND